MQPENQPLNPNQNNPPQQVTPHNVLPGQQAQSTVPQQHSQHDDMLFAAIALALSVSIAPAGIVMGIIALKKTQPHTPPRTLAKVAIWVSIVMMILFVAYVALSIASGDFD